MWVQNLWVVCNVMNIVKYKYKDGSSPADIK